MTKPSAFLTFRRLLATTLLLVLLLPRPAAAQTAQVRAVLFYSPSCPHCHQVLMEVVTPLLDEYGEQLLIVAIDVTVEEGNALFHNSLDFLEVPEDWRGVPFLIIGDSYMVGSLQIEEEFPGMIARGLAAGGIDWPQIPVLRSHIYSIPTAQPSASGQAPVTPTPLPTIQPTPRTSWQENFQRDGTGNALSVVVLTALITDGVWNTWRLRKAGTRRGEWPGWVQPVLILVGFGIAAYLARVEISQQPAICGPVGDCNAVQQSAYARLFGFLPIGLLGMFAYLSFGLLWLAERRFGQQLRVAINRLAWVLAGFGLLFSIYLTFLEPFVIGATCAWCLSSALIMGLIFWNLTDTLIRQKFPPQRKEN